MTTFTIAGRCATKGSANSFIDPRSGRKIWKADNSRLSSWTKDAKKAAMAARVPMVYKPHGVRMSVVVEFVRPKTVKQIVPSVKPDADKLLRAIFDALTGVAYADDSQVVDVTLTKIYGPVERVTVTVQGAA
jgi:Holliday junction resolvase RusA-like endonuclease